VYEIDVVLVPASPGSTVTTTKPAPGCGFACPPNSAVNTTIAPQHTTATVAQPTTTTAIPVVPDNTVSTKVPVPSVATLQTVQARSKIIGLGFTFAALGPVEADCGTGVLRAVSSVPAAGTLADPATTIVKVTFGCFSQ